MSVAVDSLRRGVRRTVLIQSAIAATVAIACYAMAGWHELVSALYGGAIVVLASLWLGLYARRAGDARDGWGERLASYSMAALRFAAVLSLLVIGLGALHLAAPPLIAAFAATHLGFMAALISF